MLEFAMDSKAVQNLGKDKASFKGLEANPLNDQDMEDPFQGGIPTQDRCLHPMGLIATSSPLPATYGLTDLDTTGVLTKLSLGEPRLLRSPSPCCWEQEAVHSQPVHAAGTAVVPGTLPSEEDQAQGRSEQRSGSIPWKLLVEDDSCL